MDPKPSDESDVSSFSFSKGKLQTLLDEFDDEENLDVKQLVRVP